MKKHVQRLLSTTAAMLGLGQGKATPQTSIRAIWPMLGDRAGQPERKRKAPRKLLRKHTHAARNAPWARRERHV